MKDNTKKTFSIYAKSAWKYKYSVITAYSLVIIVMIIGVITPLYFKELVDTFGSNAERPAIVGELFRIIKIIILLSLVDWALWRVVNFCAIFFQSKTKEDLSNVCFQYLHKNSYTYFVDNFGGSLVKKIKWFVNSFEDISDNILYNFLPITVSVASISYILFGINVWLGAGLLLWMVVFITINLIFVKYKFRYDFQQTKAETDLTGLLSDTITNHSNVKLFNGYRSESKKFAEGAYSFRKIWFLAQTIGESFFGLQALLFVALEAGIYLYAIKLWDRGLLTAGGFILMQFYVVKITSMIWNVGQRIKQLYEKLADAEEMTIVLNTPHEIKDVPGAKDLVVSEGAVTFKNVVFNYHETRSVLKNFNLAIKSGEGVALIGPSGAGKTTIVKLLFRMYDVTDGRILIDGQDIAKVTQESLWKNVSLVSQDPVLFHRSLMENIRYGRQNATDEEVVEAAKLARCHDFIMETPDKYDTFVGERGIKLSGGERQRVAIARAILKNAPILVLDEATSSLDSESELLIQDALSELMKNKTVIVIAHRLSTIKKMDRIIAVENGGIVEEGTHESLLKSKNGIYSKFWQIQAGGFTHE